MKNEPSTKKSLKLISFLKTIGPGFLLAGAAIGVSHIIQSTRAGADYGFSLIWVLILGCVSKYPFMEFAPRYLASTGNDMITGYKKHGKFAYWTYFVVTIGTMFAVQAAITIVTAGVAEQMFQLGWSPFTWSIVVLSAVILLLLIGKYSALDKTMKIIIVTLTLATLITVGLAFSGSNFNRVMETPTPSYWNIPGFLFLIAFMGWMPIPIDAAAWHTLWIKENARINKTKLTLKSTASDFNLGYLSASFLALFFLLMGALMLFGTGETFSTDSVKFSGQLVDLYERALGSWSGVVMAIAVLITLLSTLITVTDAYPRVIARYVAESDKPVMKKAAPNAYNILIVLIPIVSLLILSNFKQGFTVLVDFAAGLSFVSTAVLAFFNYQMVTSKDFPEEAKPSRTYRIFSICCLIVLSLMAGTYLVFKLFL